MKGNAETAQLEHHEKCTMENIQRFRDLDLDEHFCDNEFKITFMRHKKDRLKVRVKGQHLDQPYREIWEPPSQAWMNSRPLRHRAAAITELNPVNAADAVVDHDDDDEASTATAPKTA